MAASHIEEKEKITMKQLKTLAAVTLAAALSLSFAACGASGGESTAAPESAAPSNASSPAADTASGEVSADLITVKVGATPAPHQEILEGLAPEFEKAGIKLEVVPFTDYVMPNKTLDAGDIDANYFQHQPYLDDFNAKNGTKLISAAGIHYEPMGLYPGKTATVDALPDGAVIAVPNDTTNESRALMLLQDQGLIKLKDSVKIDESNALNVEITILDIAENPKNLDIQEFEAAQIPRMLQDVDLAVVNGNYALGAGITDSLLVKETDDIAKLYVNVLSVKEGDESRPEIQKVVDVLTGDACKQFIEEKYKGTVVPAF